MSKLGCKCGHVIVDQTDCLPYKGEIIPDKTFYDFFDKISDGIESLVEATKNGKRKEWIEQNFAAPPYPMDLTDAQMIGDIFSNFYNDLIKRIYQCENCGRIWIQVQNTNNYVPFLPETADWKDILTKNSTEK